MTDTIKFRTAVNRGRKAYTALKRSQFDLGDVAAAVEQVTYGEQTIAVLAEQISGDDLSAKTLMNYRTVALAYSPEDRSENSFSVHEILAAQDDRVDLVNGPSPSGNALWSTAEARELRDTRNGRLPKSQDDDQDGDQDGDGDEAGDVDPLAKARATVKRLEGELLKAYAALELLEAQAEDEDDDDDDDADDDEVFIHTPRRGLPEHDASEPQAGCPDCIAAGLITMPARPARRSRKRTAALAA